MTDDTIDIPDFGNFDLPDLDLGSFDFDPEDSAQTESRYIRPRLVPMRSRQVCYDNARELARNIDLTDERSRYDCIVSGSFIFGDFIEAFMTTHNCKAVRMTITTLSLSQENVDSLATLMQKGYIDRLDMVVSDYFFSHERHGLIPYMYQELDIGDRFQLAVAFVHTKTVHFETLGGRKIVIHGSANLRTSGNVEQFTVEENAELHDFYEEAFRPVIDRFKTINRTAPRKTQWADRQPSTSKTNTQKTKIMAGQTGSNGNKGGNSVKAAPTPAKRRRYNTKDFTFSGEAAPF